MNINALDFLKSVYSFYITKYDTHPKEQLNKNSIEKKTIV